MTDATFIYEDAGHAERQSDGVEMLIIPGQNDGKICFYCNEQDVIWPTLESVDTARTLQRSRSTQLRSATLHEICDQGLVTYVDLVKEHQKTQNVTTRIYLRQHPFKSDCFGYLAARSAQPGETVLFCRIPEYYDENIYLFSPIDGSMWLLRNHDEQPSKAMKNLRVSKTPASAAEVFDRGHIDKVVAAKEYRVNGEAFSELQSIEL
jgi:hypothetical protein